MTAAVTSRPDIPHRKLVRSWLDGTREPRTALALLYSALDFTLLGAAMAGVLLLDGVVLKLLSGLAAGFVIGRLFILGHDACHQSFSARRRLNAVLGRLLMLPSLTPYSLWDIGHNVVHHGYTNLRDFDFVWQPKTLQEYRALPPACRLLERIYRSGWAPWLYYVVEIWWKRLFFPSRRYMPTRRRVFVRDSLLVTVFALTWLAGLITAAGFSGQSAALMIVAGFLLPQLVWNAMIGFIVYVHHTHPRVTWYQDKAAWSASQPFVSTTVRLGFRGGTGALIHHINEHTAHHVDMTIPLYRLQEAQRILERRLRGCIVVQPFSWRWYFDTARRCKLYDYEVGRWTDFGGHPTT